MDWTYTITAFVALLFATELPAIAGESTFDRLGESMSALHILSGVLLAALSAQTIISRLSDMVLFS